MAHYVEYAGVDSEWELWHARMGHLNKDALAKTQRATTGMPTLEHMSMTLFGGCMKGKQTVAHFPSRSMSKTTKVLQLVHTDVMGPMKTKSKAGRGMCSRLSMTTPSTWWRTSSPRRARCSSSSRRS
ncbi:hypothetical protein PF007_g31425 [Phytophthora fragariae]|uniref:GAG-pre-integrase domain-containing protein n=1 Tax=Phytophthora fragariae TaxID=53985 RepID=A0A6A3PJV9_9STRA|nr:hypothetical protein PF011_g32102 [Phytophthora fragariae]KAE9055980.1 hypothetical protein PF006_g32817 [Phytophthora fragariae]KAE9058076.1 hypothetical protein PF007_g31425 [Phytophthora fragariae]KAE9264424.1 hypothetical protein PF001_g31282 [Phytophthora fragariae]